VFFLLFIIVFIKILNILRNTRSQIARENIYDWEYWKQKRFHKRILHISLITFK